MINPPGHSRHVDHFKAWLNALLVASHNDETFLFGMQGDAGQPRQQRALEQQPKMTARAVSGALVSRPAEGWHCCERYGQVAWVPVYVHSIWSACASGAHVQSEAVSLLTLC